MQWSFKHPKPVTQTVPRHLRRSVTTAAAAPGAGGWQLWGPVWVGFELGNFGVRFGLDLDWVLLGRVIDGWDEGSSDFRDPDLPLHFKSRVTSTFKGNPGRVCNLPLPKHHDDQCRVACQSVLDMICSDSLGGDISASKPVTQ